MEIGTKIKNARNEAGVTQEQAAEYLGVSRQTISNWENEKTYPDIISVIKMSDLYSVTLDHLLKEENPVKKNYMDYLEESTNVVKSRNKLSKIILVSVYLGIWTVSLIFFWLFMSGSDAAAFSFIVLWIVLPIATFIISLMMAKRELFGKAIWLLSLAFGFMYMMAEYATFSTANMVSFNHFNIPNFGMFGFGTLFALLGIAIGTASRKISENRFKKKG